MTTTETYSLRVERIIPGAAAAVFDAWLDPESLKRWMRPGPDMTVPAADVDPRVGGRFRIVMKHAERELPHEGEYRVIDRPRRLVFTWVSEPAGHSLVTVEFHPLDDGRTRVVLTHEKLATAESRDAHAGGWTRLLELLEQQVA